MYVNPIGLDFGTNNSVIGVIVEGSHVPSFIKTETGDTLHGSYVFYPENSTEPPIFGKEALAMLPSKNVVRLAKRALGVSASSIENTTVFNADITALPVNRHICFNLNVDGIVIKKSSKEVVVDFLRHYRQLVVDSVGESVAWVVSKPQNWSSPQNKAFSEALEAAGISPLLKIITEPSAATFAYRAKAGEDPNASRTLVADLGAGTFDVVLLVDMGQGNFRSVAVGGNDKLGSSNVDELLLGGLLQEIKSQPGFSQEAFEEQRSEIREKMKAVKHLLSSVPTSTTIIRGITTTPFKFEIDLEKKKMLLKKFYEQAEKALQDALANAANAKKKHTVEQIKKSVDVVALVGGGMRDPHFGNVILPTMFPKAKIVGKPNQRETINPDIAVATGNTYWAAALNETTTVHGLPPDPIHSQLLSRSLGVETVTNYGDPSMKRWFHRIIKTNTAIPTTVLRDGFTTVKDNQDQVIIEIYQGEGELTTDDDVVCIGKYNVPLITPNFLNNPPSIEIEMEVTEDNILVVRAGEKGCDKKEIRILDQL